MEKKLLSWFDKAMIYVCFAEAGVETPDISHLDMKGTVNVFPAGETGKRCEPFEGKVVPVQ